MTYILHSMTFTFKVSDDPEKCIKGAISAFNTAVKNNELILVGRAQATVTPDNKKPDVINVTVRGAVKSNETKARKKL